MDVRRISAVFCLFMGVSMVGLWGMLLATDSVPEIDTAPEEIFLHVAGEMATAISLIVAGYGLWSSRAWGFDSYLIASGLLSYTLIVSPGYYATKGETVFLVMFMIFLVVDVLLLIANLNGRRMARRSG